MQSSPRTAIFQSLQQKILQMEGLRGVACDQLSGILSPLRNAFPNKVFPVGAVHEFLCGDPEARAATSGFVTGLLSSLCMRGGAVLWISPSRILFPPALKAFGVQPDKFLFVEARKANDIMWVTNEALKCEALGAVVAEVSDMDFTESRRLQLAVEQSRVTGFVLRTQTLKHHATACVSRWRVTQIPSEPFEGLPGIGFPQWKVDLLKIRNGKPGSWTLRWEAGNFILPLQDLAEVSNQQKKAG